MPLATLLLVCTGAAVASAVEAALALRRRRTRIALGAAIGAFTLIAVVLALSRMGFGEQKVLARLIMPAGLLWLALFAAAVTALRLGHRRGAAAAFGLFVAYSIAGSVPLGRALVRRLERAIPPAPANARFEAVFVLGGGTQLGRGGAPQLGPAGDRVRLAAALWHQGRTPLLVASGRSPPPYGLGNLADHTVELWGQMGVPRDATLTLGGRNTSEEVAAYAELARAQGWARTGLVTSAWHLPRAMAQAKRQGFEVTPLPADFRAGRPRRALHPVFVVPQRAGFELIEIAAWEYLGRWLGR